jgi:hypothetical protein
MNLKEEFEGCGCHLKIHGEGMSDFLTSIVTSPDPSGTLVPAGRVHGMARVRKITHRTRTL